MALLAIPESYLSHLATSSYLDWIKRQGQLIEVPLSEFVRVHR